MTAVILALSVLLFFTLFKFDIPWFITFLPASIIALSLLSLIRARKEGNGKLESAKLNVRDTDHFFDEIYLTSTNLQEDSEEFKNVSSKMSEISNDLQQKSKKISGLVQSLTAALEETSSGTSEITKSVEVINSNVQRMYQDFGDLEKSVIELEGKTQTISQENEAARNSLSDLSESMKKLSSTSSSINQMVQVISQIAEQTNLLALNAAIEAARAGESGKGFAVVAEEIRKLAEQSKRAAQEISQQIEAIGSLIIESVNKNDVVAKTLQSTISISEQFVEQLSKIRRNTETFKRSIKEIRESVQNQVSATKEIELAISNNVQSSSEILTFVDETEKVVDMLSNLSRELSSGADILSIKSLKLKSLAGAREWLLAEINELIQLLNTQECRNLNWSSFEPLAKNFLSKKSDVYETIFIADSSGNFVTTTGSKGNISDRAYFNYLKSSHATWTISDPLKSRATGNMVLTFAYAIREDGRFKGIAGANFRLERLKKELKQMNNQIHSQK